MPSCNAFDNVDKIMKFHTFMVSKFKSKCNDFKQITRGSMGERDSVGEIC